MPSSASVAATAGTRSAPSGASRRAPVRRAATRTRIDSNILDFDEDGDDLESTSGPQDGVKKWKSRKVEPTNEGSTEASFSKRGKTFRITTRPANVNVADTVNYARRAQQKKPWFVIDPRNSKHMQRWDAVTVFALLFTATFTPVEVAFLNSAETFVDPLFLFNRLIDLIFIFDFILNFLLMFETHTMDGNRWHHEPKAIARNYLRTWFTLDLLSIVVSAFDFIAVAEAGTSEDGESSGVAKLKVLRVLRILRLIKLLRLLRMSRIGKRWESKVAINYGAVALCKAFGSVLFGSHLFACLWTLQSDLFADNRHDTWLGNVVLDGSPLCWPREGADLSKLPTDDATIFQGNSICKNAGQLYVTSLYWAIMTITSIGYGDVSPVLWSEQLMSTIIMLLGSVLWGQVIATFCGVVATFNPEAAEFRRTMDDLNRFMSLQGLDSDLRARLREYFHQTKHLRVASAHRRLISQMSPTLQSKLTLMCNERWLRRVEFLDGAEEGFIIQLALQLTAMVFAPAELAPPGYLYIVHRGVALYGGRVLTAGKVWGDDMIVMNENLRRPWCARAMNYLEVFLISRDELLETARNFPFTRRLIRRAALLLALRRYLITIARAKNGFSSSGGRDKMGSAFLEASTATDTEKHSMHVQQAIVNHTHANQKLLEADLYEAPQLEAGLGSPQGKGDATQTMEEFCVEMKNQLASTREFMREQMQETHGTVVGLQEQITSLKQQVHRLCDALIKE